MANSTTGLRWVLDTEATISLTMQLRINRIVWNSPTTGDILEITDGAGNEIAKVTCAADASQIVEEFGNRSVTGLILADLDGGTVSIDLI